MPRAAPDELAERIARIKWFHRIELAPGVWTPGIKGEGTQKTLTQMHLPADLSGRTVLDIGAWDGFYSFEAERRGANVLATDSFCWSDESWASKDGFDLAKEVLGSKVDEQFIDPSELAPEKVGGTFDVVFFLGVLYHLQNPLQVLERVASVTGGLLVLETHVDLRAGEDVSAAAFYPGTELNEDPTNWWGPNPRCVRDLLEVVGFNRFVFYPDKGRHVGGIQELPKGRIYPRRRKFARLIVHASRG